jgi:SAM-dependent methyltransferase
MIKLESSRPSSKLGDKLYSTGVKFVQDTFVRADVWLDAKRGRHRAREPGDDLKRKLQALGLVPERFWWGPLTLLPEKLEFLINEIERHPPRLVLEIGCGVSTALFTALAEKYDFYVYSIENHPGTVDYVQDLLEGTGFKSRLTIQQCRFARKQAGSEEPYYWFDADLARAGSKFDFVFVDGPMAQLVGRRGTLPEIANYLTPEHRIFLDDGERQHERECVAEWTRQFSQLNAFSPVACRDLIGLCLNKV